MYMYIRVVIVVLTHEQLLELFAPGYWHPNEAQKHSWWIYRKCEQTTSLHE